MRAVFAIAVLSLAAVASPPPPGFALAGRYVGKWQLKEAVAIPRAPPGERLPEAAVSTLLRCIQGASSGPHCHGPPERLVGGMFPELSGYASMRLTTNVTNATALDSRGFLMLLLGPHDGNGRRRRVAVRAVSTAQDTEGLPTLDGFSDAKLPTASYVGSAIVDFGNLRRPRRRWQPLNVTEVEHRFVERARNVSNVSAAATAGRPPANPTQQHHWLQESEAALLTSGLGLSASAAAQLEGCVWWADRVRVQGHSKGSLFERAEVGDAHAAVAASWRLLAACNASSAEWRRNATTANETLVAGVMFAIDVVVGKAGAQAETSSAVAFFWLASLAFLLRAAATINESETVRNSAAKMRRLSVGGLVWGWCTELIVFAGVVTIAPSQTLIPRVTATAVALGFVAANLFSVRLVIEVRRSQAGRDGTGGISLWKLFLGVLALEVVVSILGEHVLSLPVVLLPFLQFIPQIVRNVKLDEHLGPSRKFVGLITISFLLPTCYVLLAPGMLVTAPRPVAAAVLVSVAFAQAAVLVFQQRHGARAIVPQCLRPTRHVYAVPPSQVPSLAADDQECPICQSSLLEAEEGQAALAVWQTPCRHLFHSECLVDWILKEEHMDCPLCRAPLPRP